MRGAVTEQGQGFRTPVRHDADDGVLVNGTGEIDESPVNESGQGRFGEVGRDPFRHVADRRAGWHSATRAIRKRDGDLTHGEKEGRVQLSALRPWDALSDS